MIKRGWRYVVIVCSGALLAGCSMSTPGISRELGSVDYGSAFAAAREVFSQHYPVAEANADTGVIKARPVPVDERGERILGGKSPARQLATLSLRRKNGLVIAHASVAVQRQGSEPLRRMRVSREEDYSSVPHQTPAELEGATTPEQNETWTTQRYAHDRERMILDDLYRALHPQP